MLREVLHSKIHRAAVTAALPDYVGSITIDASLLVKCGMRVNDKVLVTNCRNGERFETYIFKGKKGSKAIEVNGSAAHLVEPGDRVIIMHFALMTDREYRENRPRVLIMDEQNNITETMRYKPS
ncbi:MAG: aspartate 1-decarboxylase [Phycisphaerales bacterium]|nr:aspartate 1-decarboxylase [Phycisphaerales bacterium]